MARPSEWRRAVHEFSGSAQSLPGHQVLLCEISPGETLTRIRFRWQASHYGNGTFNGTGFLVGAGIIALPSTGTFPVPHPLHNERDPWIWWSAVPFHPVQSYFDPGGLPHSLDIAPYGPDEIDVKAQRRSSPVGDLIYFVTGTSTLSPDQSDHYLSVSASCLVLLPE